jgi:hypothetical protein
MRLTPAQCAMHGLLGIHFPFWGEEPPLTDCIRHGHESLVKITGLDLGYDPHAWHEYLRTTNAGGYRWSNKHFGFPRQIPTALARPDWQDAVASLRAGQGSDPAV